jgi:hypothetical protein
MLFRKVELQRNAAFFGLFSQKPRDLKKHGPVAEFFIGLPAIIRFVHKNGTDMYIPAEFFAETAVFSVFQSVTRHNSPSFAAFCSADRYSPAGSPEM